MEISVLHEFKIVATLKNIDEASKALYLPKANIVRHLRDLESETGLKLFEDSKFSTLTLAGKKYLQIISTFLIVYKQGVEKAQAEQRLKRNELTLHAPDHQELVTLMFKAVRKLYKRNPLTAVKFISLYRKSPDDAIKTGFVDVAVMFRYGNEASLVEEYLESNMQAIPIQKSRLALWLPKTHRISHLGFCKASDLENITIVIEAVRHDPMRIAADAFCAAHNVSPRFKVVTSNNTQDLFLKCDEPDCALLVTEDLESSETHREVFPDFAVVPFKEPDAFVTSFLIAKEKPDTHDVSAFFDCVKKCLQSPERSE